MKRSLILFTAALICAVSCGTAGEYAEAGRFQDGIYYKPDPKGNDREPATEDDFRSRASIHNYARQNDSVTIAVDDLDYYYWGWRPYAWYPYHWGYYSHWGYPYYHWGYYQHFGYSYWGYPYYWDYYGWYDPWYWDYGYYGYPYYYGGGWYNRDSGGYSRRSGSATAGVYSHPGVSGRPGAVRSVSRVTGSRTASAAARRDLDRLNSSRTTPRTTAVNREPNTPEIQNYRRASATRASSSASSNSYNGSRDTGSYRYESSSRSSGSSRSSSGWSGGGSTRSSGGSHAGGSSHSSGGSYHGGGGGRR